MSPCSPGWIDSIAFHPSWVSIIVPAAKQASVKQTAPAAIASVCKAVSAVVRAPV